jgi:WD40 repeat protein
MIYLSHSQHDAPIKTVHWIKAPNYSCIMTGSWDKTLKVTYSFNQIEMIDITEKNKPEDGMCQLIINCCQHYL